MLRSLAHLGPDGASLLCDGSLGLGYRAMAITHEDAFDSQPLADPDSGDLLTADARLDNREQLAAELEITADVLATTADAALILAAWRRWGEACAEHLLGDFAFAVWDAAARRLLLVRDHMGQRHVFYHLGADFLAFATEIKGVWAAPDVPRRISDAGFEEVFVRRWHRRQAERTKFEGVSGLMAGSVMIVGANGAVSKRRYWEPRADPAQLGHDDAYYVRAYRDVLAEAVACRLRRATRPCSLLLSGGFDSSSIAALAGAALGGRKLVTVTSAAAEPAADGLPDARRWVEVCRGAMPHLDVRYITRAGRTLFSGLDRAIANNDGAVSVNTYVNDELYATAAAAGARVVMDGHGGDYTLNPRGYFPVARLLAMGRWRAFAAEFAATARVTRRPLWRTAWSEVLAAFAPSWARQVLGALRGGGGSALAPPDPINLDLTRRLRPLGSTPLADRATPSLVHSRRNLLRAQRRMQNYTLLSGTLPAMHGLEFTQPFHDKRVIELALAIPEDLYYRGGRPRYLARMALADVLPEAFQSRSRRNTPFNPDLMQMAKTEAPKMLAEIDRLQAIPRLTGYFDFARMRRMLVQTPADARNPRAPTRVRRAMRALVWARYLEWFLKDNAELG